MFEGLFGKPSRNVVLAIVALHPDGIRFSDIQAQDVWCRYAGRAGTPSTRSVARALDEWKNRGLLRECGKRWKPDF